MEPIEIEIDYFKKPGVSNSFLGDVSNIINGRSLFKCSKETLDFGSQLHEAILEQNIYEKNKLLPSYLMNAHKIKEMIKSARKNALLKIFLDSKDSEFEKEHFFTLVYNGNEILCKLKADIKNRLVVGDLKSTDATTREEFLIRAKEYGYMRQGAFYLDGTGCSKFIIFAISKKSPYPMFTYVLDRNSEELEQGRAEYQYLIGQYLKLSPEQLETLKRK